MKREERRGKGGKGDSKDNLCWGRNGVISMLETAPEACHKIYMATGSQRSFRDEILGLAGPNAIEVVEAGGSHLDDLTGGEKHQGVVAEIEMPRPLDLSDLPDKEGPSLLLIMDHLKDPHNFGAIIRTAEVAGADGIVFPGRRSVGITGTVIKTSAGAIFRLPLFEVVNLVRALEDLKKRGYWVVGLDHRSERDIWDSPLPDRLALVVGSEGEGISRLVSERCDDLRKIPMVGETGSLNASVASALGMFEWRRLNLPTVKD
nr:23S rRNA (guanosine(2251)-2'-O)-methyltransferase RlmB [uncultured Dethiosulfovibrio sp.]